MFFANPWGFLALLAVPALVAVYFLQRKSRVVPTSTLFLLDPAWKESVAGRRFERFRNSAPFWLQLLAILLLTWVIAGPRFVRSDSVLRVALVLDSSVSMQAFRAKTRDALAKRMRGMDALASHVEWVLLESDRRRPTLYSGGRLDEAVAALDAWQPWSPAHDPADALRSAMAGAGRDALVVFVTDRETDVPEGVTLFSAAEAIGNAGFAAPRISGVEWEAWVVNSGTSELRRKWWTDFSETAGRRRPGGAPAGEVLVAPGATSVLKGTFEATHTAVWLEQDGFAVDDVMLFVKPEPKPLRVDVRTQADFARRFTATLDATRPPDGAADLTILACDPAGAVPPVNGAAVVHAGAAGAQPRLLGGLVVAEKNPLTIDLNWRGLLVPDGPRFAPQAGDQVLVWVGETPVIFLRPAEHGANLMLNFDPDQSNAARHPAFVLLLHRFAEEMRRALPVPWRGNFDCDEELNLAPGGTGTAELRVDGGEKITAHPGDFRAPLRPAFFEVTTSGTRMVDGAAHFADLSEADFRKAAPLDTIRAAEARMREEHSAEDHLAPLWMLLAIGALLAGWGQPWKRP